MLCGEKSALASALKIGDDCFAKDIHFQIEWPADLLLSQGCHVQRCGNQRDLKIFFTNTGNCQADAIDSDRALGREIFPKRRGASIVSR